jgi:Rps23 Pro-64 3,4-dihydroxylase Tpa1-like proline 4-hydroxylase
MRSPLYVIILFVILFDDDTEGLPYRSSCKRARNDHMLPLMLSTSTSHDRLFPTSVYDTIQQGKIAVIPDFLPKSEILSLQRDAEDMHASNHFSTDALSSYGSSGKFDPSKDRTVLKLSQWKNTALGDWSVRKQFSARIRDLRSDLSVNLQRPGLVRGTSISTYGGEGSTEISYTRFGPGAYLKRHVDEHHEELKGTAGWLKPTRRSLSWLIYLNENWNSDRNGGCLRCYERTFDHDISHHVGARPNGDLQIGWLRPSLQDPKERPVFLDAQCGSGDDSDTTLSHHYCAMYIDDPRTTGMTLQKYYITQMFSAHPTLFVAGGEFLAQQLLVKRKDYANRFYFIEPPKSLITDWIGRIQGSQYGNSRHTEDESSMDIAPLAATLVIFDSVTLPHEVLPSLYRPRWATSGWMHEDQQSIETHPFRYNNVDDSRSNSIIDA